MKTEDGVYIFTTMHQLIPGFGILDFSLLSGFYWDLLKRTTRLVALVAVCICLFDLDLLTGVVVQRLIFSFFSILIFYSFLLIRLCWQEPWWCSTVSTVAVCWMPHCSFSGYYLARVPPGPWQFQLLTAHHGRWAGQIWKQLTLGPRVWGGWQISKLKWKY